MKTKKILSSLLAFMLIWSTFTFNTVNAAQSAFENVDLSNVELIDDATVQRGNQPIQFVQGYGIGYSGLNDMVRFKDIDFGSNGADEMIISFSYGDINQTTLDIYVDNPEGTPAASYAIGNTGGWEIKYQIEISTPISVSAGIHDIYVKFTNDQSGSFSYIRFKEEVIPPGTIYLKDGGSGDGSTFENPVGSWTDAFSKLSQSGGKIYVIGSMAFADSLPGNSKLVTILGYDGNAVLTIKDGQSVAIRGDITLENINITSGDNAHIDSRGYKFIIGNNVTSANETLMIHGGAHDQGTVPGTSLTVLNSHLSTYYVNGAYLSDPANGVTGDCNVMVDGGSINKVVIGADGYASNHVGGTIGGNVDIVVNSGKINTISKGTNTIINGAIQLIFNNGAKPSAVDLPASAANIYQIYAGAGGKVELTETVGIYKITSNYDIYINGKKKTPAANNRYVLAKGISNVEFINGIAEYIGEVAITLPAPVGGGIVDMFLPSVSAEATYSASLNGWESASDTVAAYGIFDFETVYTGKVSVVPGPGKYFGNNVKYYINGKEAVSEKGENGSMILSGVFPATGTAPTHIANFVSGSESATGEAPAQDGSSWKFLSKYKLPACSFKIKNKAFVGWNDGSETYKAGENYVMRNSDVTFTAEWKTNIIINSESIPFVLILYNIKSVKDYGKNPDFPKNKKYPKISLGSAAFASLENTINGTKGLPDSTYDSEKVKVIKTDDNNDTKVCVNNWSLASTKAAVENYKYVSFTYYYETTKTTGGAIGKTPSVMAGYFQLPDGSNSKWLAKYIAGNKQIVANKWDTITFDIGACATENNIDPKAVLKQIHFYLLGTDTTTAAIKGDSVYLKDFVFSADLPVDHSADKKTEEKK